MPAREGGVCHRGEERRVDQPLGITIESLAADTVCVELSGELDFSRAYTFDEEMRRLEAQKPNSIVLDLRKLNFLDSAGLGRVLAVQRRASRDGRRLVVVRGCRAVERLFALSALDMRLEMVSEPSAALQGSPA
jgi:anti-anti-sigma factor